MIESVVGVNIAALAIFTASKLDIFNTIYGTCQLFMVLQFTYFILILKGVNKMVDVVTNRVFDTYNRFSPLNNHQNDSLATLSTLKRFSRDQKYKKALNREADIKAREAQLFDIKEHAPDAQVQKRRPFMGLSCQNCTLTSRSRYSNIQFIVMKRVRTKEPHIEVKLVKLVFGYTIFINGALLSNPKDEQWLVSKTFSHLYQVYELKKYDYPQLSDLVLKDDRLKRAVEKVFVQQFKEQPEESDEIYQQLLKNNQKRAKKLLYDMRSTLSDFLLRFTTWVLYKLLPCFLTSVVVHPGQVEMLKKASKSSLPLIFLPLHRSHLDYILISFILLNNNIRSPLVAAGDNLRIPFFGHGSKDLLYKASITYVHMNNCLRAGHNIEFFLEGVVVRTGKPCMPKYGILSVILETFMDGTIEDALLVPVSVNYEKLVDGNFVREQLGQPKEMETFGNAIRGIWSVLNSNYGMMRIDFNQPFSLRELVKTFNMSGKAPLTNGIKTLQSNPSTSSLYGTDIVSEENKSLVESISKHIIYAVLKSMSNFLDCAQSTSIMSTNALAFLLLTKFREGASIEELVIALDNLRKELEYARRDLGFTGDSIDVIKYAADILGPASIRKEKGQNNEEIIKPIAILPNVIELTYYSNTLVTHFALDSVVAIALNALDLTSGSVIHQDLVENVMDLCDILQYEFLFCKPCQGLEQIVTSCIDDLIIRKQIFLVVICGYSKVARQFDDNDEEDMEYSKKIYKLNPNKYAVDVLQHMRMILMPLIDELVKDVLDELKSQLTMGTIEFGKASSFTFIKIHTIGKCFSGSSKNALKLYQKWGILECHSDKKLRLYYLRDDQGDSESVKVLYKKVNKYRQSV
ncbi:hypothetical protein NQ317_008203 [Molorchus minor]|uniref:Phospholipid/glycerol acyltransferase domain-containing protein n=1 Tax=Molorchus minor TaxID=1323400 RepID=A0ABQ9J9G9_9CUCU|nr:hypothetical protein NQ317_008203 [Molorchus minor]